MQMNELQRTLDRTKVALMSNRDAVFFTTIVFSLKFLWDDKCPTAYTDGYVLGFNPNFFMRMPPEERVGVMVHEACHVAYDHMGRLQGRDMFWWNMAADHVINLDLEARGFKLPAFRLADSRFVGMSTEQVYEILKQENNQDKNEMEDIRVQPGSDSTEHARHIEDIIVRAVVQTRMQNNVAGAIPGEVELFLQRLFRPRLPWQTILRREVQETIKQGYTWMRPNRRYFPKFHLPSAWSQGLVEANFYVDISGSVTDHQFTVFISEIAGVMKMFNLRKITIVQFDTQIHHINTIKNLRDLANVKFHGRGGTHIECILQHMEKTRPQLAMVFTDGHFYWPRERFNQRLLWLINDNEKFVPRFGKAIHFTTKGT